MLIAVLDTETTGIPVDLDDGRPHPVRHYIEEPRVIEVGAVLFSLTERGVDVVDTFDSLARPEDALWRDRIEETERFHRITTRMLEAAPRDFEVGRALEDWLLAQRPACLVSYRVAFDFHCKLLGSTTWLARVLQVLPIGPCLMELAARAAGRSERTISLQRAREHFGLPPLTQPHWALCDARGAGELIPKIWPPEWRPPAPNSLDEAKGEAPPLSRWELLGEAAKGSAEHG